MILFDNSFSIRFPVSVKDTRADRAMQDINLLLGRRVRVARLSLGLSQAELGDSIGVSHQQVQKYESGKNEFRIARLLKATETLNLSLPELLTDIMGEPASESANLRQMMQAFTKLSPKQQSALLCLAESISPPNRARRK